MTTTNRKIASISALLMLIAFIGNSFSMFKEMLVARAFGISAHMDAFYAALAIPTFISCIFAALLSSIFIPLYTGGSGKEERDELASSIINWTALSSLAFMIPLTLAPTLFTGLFFRGLPPASADMAAALLRQLNWTIPFSFASGLFIGVLNAKERFALPAASTLAVTLTIMTMVVYFSRQLGIYALSYGMLGGMALQTALLFREMKASGFRYTPSFSLKDPAAKAAFGSAGVFLIAILLNQTTSLMGQMLASWLPQGSVTAMNYAGKLLQLPMTVFSSAIVTAVLPYFSRQVEDRDWNGLAYSTARSIRMTAYVFIPFTLLNFVFAKPVIKLLFERGQFDGNATTLIATTFICFAPQIFFNTAGMILSRVFFAIKDLRVFLWINLLMLPLNLVMSLALMRLVSPPVAGLALASSLAFMLSFLLLYRDLKLKLPLLDTYYILKGAALAALAGAGSATAAWLSFSITGCGHGTAGLLTATAIAGTAAFAVMAALSHILRIDEYRSVIAILKEKIGGIAR